jgi:hypothetical protein
MPNLVAPGTGPLTERRAVAAAGPAGGASFSFSGVA